jgi:molybdopterin-guanine dinucleotide biosynthesis protein MobB
MLEGRIIGVCGHKDTGKTRVVEGLVKFLKAKGFSVGTVKHAHGPIVTEPGATDSARHLAAGADCAVVEGGEIIQISMKPPATPKQDSAPEPQCAADDVLEAAARHLFACDYIVVEGFKRADIPKIVVTARAGDVPEGLTQVVACVGDGAKPDGLPAFELDEISALGAFLFDKHILAPVGPTAHLVVDGRPIPMNEFVTRALSGTLEGFLTSLRDVESPTTIEISIKRLR